MVKHEEEGVKSRSFRTHIGGAATIDGVMMRGQHSWAVAVRMASGSIHVEEHDLEPWQSHRPKGPLSWPIVRGCFSFASSFALSTRALTISTSLCTLSARQVVPRSRLSQAGRLLDSFANRYGTPIGVAAGILLGLALFVVVPAGITTLAIGEQTAANSLAWSVCEAALRCLVLVTYLAIIGQTELVSTTLAYHGAEHKVIHCFEHADKLDPERCHTYSRYHVRCGTSFLVTTFLAAVVVNTVAPIPEVLDVLGLDGFIRFAGTVAIRLLLLPLVVGISYEVSVRWAGQHPVNPLVRLLTWPGMAMQRLTTREPDDQMLECAIRSLEAVHARDLRERWKIERGNSIAVSD